MDGSILLQFLAIFLAASLAFFLEDIRERRRTRRWVERHLRHLAELMSSEAGQAELLKESGERQLAAIDAWLAADREPDVSEEQWEIITQRWNSSMIDLGPILRGEALSVLNESLAHSLATFEHNMRYVDVTTNVLSRELDDIHDAWAEREVPLSPANARRVKLFRATLEDLQRYMPDALGRLHEIVTKAEAQRHRSVLSRV